MTTFYRRFRLRHGLRWQANRPSAADLREALRCAALIVGLLLAFGIVGTIDYAVEQRAAADRAELETAAAYQQLADCANGRTSWISADENGRPVGVVCRTAEEFRL